MIPVRPRLALRRRTVVIALGASIALALSGLGHESAFASTRSTLAVSLNTDRSNAVQLDGSTVTGKIYVFVRDSKTLDRVDFYLDSRRRTEPPVRAEPDPPFDFAGTAADGTALPYDTTKLADGSHTIQAVLRWSDGHTSSRRGHFTVANKGGTTPTTTSPMPPTTTASATSAPTTTAPAKTEPSPTPTPTKTEPSPTPTPTSRSTTTSPTPPTSTTTSPTPTARGACSGITVTPTSDIQAAINSNPNGTAFCFSPGTYNVSSLAPKSGQLFDGGNRAAILDGQDTRQYAFRSSGTSNVTIRGFVIKRYNTPLQAGAVQSFGTIGWTIENNQITDNAASGVATDSGAKVLNNKIDWNGQQGYAAHGDNILYEGNEIAYNNHDLAVDATWEAGGGKAWDTRHAMFKNNNVHDNGGNGLWDDTNNIYITYDGNTVTNNWGAGIYHEIGYDAIIVNNTITGNGMPSSPGGGQRLGWGWDAGIQIRASQSLSAANPLLISRNVVTNNYNGISLLNSPASGCTNSGEGRYGPCTIKNVLVKDNAVTASQGEAAGAHQDGAGDAIFTSNNNHFEGNRYCVASSTHPNDGYSYGWLPWHNDWPSFTSWRGFGLDTAGSFTVGGTCQLP
jgi:parallel beta-helix repeat protein